MLVGDVIYRHPHTSAHGTVYPCTVVYIHPKRRFYTVRFDFDRGDVVMSFRESYYFRFRAGDPEYISGAVGAARTEKYRLKKGRKKRE